MDALFDVFKLIHGVSWAILKRERYRQTLFSTMTVFDLLRSFIRIYSVMVAVVQILGRWKSSTIWQIDVQSKRNPERMLLELENCAMDQSFLILNILY